MAGKTDKERLIEKIPQDGSFIGNVFLRKELKWDEKKYWEIRNELIDEDIIGIGRGKGGSVYRKINIKAATEKTPKIPKIFLMVFEIARALTP